MDEHRDRAVIALGIAGLDVAAVLVEQPFVSGLEAEQLRRLADHAQLVHVLPDEYLFRIGGPADRFFALARGRIALELDDPAGGPHVVDTVEAGDVLGWSWYVPPHRWFFDARAVTSTLAVAVDGLWLRQECRQDVALGFAVLDRVTRVMYQRLQGTRVRLLDVYGRGHVQHS